MPNMTEAERIDHVTAYHPPVSADIIQKHAEVRAAINLCMHDFDKILGEVSREKSLAMTSLEAAMYHANAHIARVLNYKQP